MSYRLTIIAFGAVFFPAAISAQWTSPGTGELAAWTIEPEAVPTAVVVVGSAPTVPLGLSSDIDAMSQPAPTLRTAGGATLGWLAGAAVGYGLGQLIEEDEFDPGYWVAGLVTAPLGAAAGAHLGNGREGSLLLTSLASVGMSLAIVAVANPLNVAGFYERNPATAVGIAFGLQVGMATAVQLWSARR